MKAQIGLVALAVGVLTCAPEPAPVRPAVDTGTRPINDGDIEQGEPSVVVIFNEFFGAMCSASLIGKRVVLTAKHCVQTDNGDPLPTSGWIVGVGPNIFNLQNIYRVVQVRRTPGATIANSDISLLILDQDAVEKPYRYKWEIPETGFIGSDVNLIGFGQDGCPDGSSGIKYRTTDVVISWQTANDFVTQGRGANSGDSGGPVFDAETMEVVGVMSRAGIVTCDGVTVNTRVDTFRDMINEALFDTGDCVPDGPDEVCNDFVDNNCDGNVDEGCLPTGTVCTEHPQCASRLCVDVGPATVCADGCDLDGASNQCGANLYCKMVDCDRGACVPGSAGALPVSATCEEDTDCESLLCRDAGAGTKVCMVGCEQNTGFCLASEACVPLVAEQTCGGCAPASLAVGPFGLGEVCTGDADCGSGSCVDDGVIRYCSQSCDEETACPSGFHCRDGSCLRGEIAQIGDPCAANDDCGSTLVCLPEGESSYCTTSCEGGEACPPGTACEGGVCATPFGPVGESCQDAIDCGTGGCFRFDGDRYCTDVCGRGLACPPTSVCVYSDEGVTLCQSTRLPVDTSQPEVPDGPKKGGCSAAGSGNVPGLTILLFGLLVLFRRRP